MTTSTESRPRGVTVWPMPEPVTGPFSEYALLVRDNSEGLAVRMVHTEGVAYLVTDEKPWTWNDHDESVPKFTPSELIDMAAKVSEGVDLADWVRTFGARLESNFYQAYAWATEGV